MTWQQAINDVGGKVMSRTHQAILKLSGGRILHSAFGMPVVELHTIGRTTGKHRTTMLASPLQDDDRIVLVASKGGDDRDPEWYRNLTANPRRRGHNRRCHPSAPGPHRLGGGEGDALATDCGGLQGLRRVPGQDEARYPRGDLRVAPQLRVRRWTRCVRCLTGRYDAANEHGARQRCAGRRVRP